MLFSNLTVILSRSKLSENIGSVARVCANMGCPNLSLVAPRSFAPETARNLGTSQGEEILNQVDVHADVHSALAPMHRVYATTARTGRWRKRILLPDQAATQIMDELESGLHVALLFGPEDKGLANAEIELCSELISIPTAPGAWSLNLSHAVLILLYECFKHKPAELKSRLPKDNKEMATQSELRLLFEAMQESLQRIDFLHEQNADYFMMPLRRFLGRMHLKRYEYNLLMGICRQVQWMARQTASSATKQGHGQ
ncbi:MAG: TrmJ/YjtD family RNA methyltransferase [Desulfovermiculus sp.]|nr:TrmJ/YjtD family RNA methyltransferase [Desulfovermiculus sp.]